MSEVSYETMTRCSNCGWTGPMSQMKGQRISMLYCPNCQCQGTLGPAGAVSGLGEGEKPAKKKSLLRG